MNGSTRYVIDPRPQRHHPFGAQPETPLDATIVIVGCGGTGSFLASRVCRLLIGRQAEVYLVDHDIVEPHNVARQDFTLDDVGRPKAQILAERLSNRKAGFRRVVGYALAPFDAQVHTLVFRRPARLQLVVGCVDNAAARREIAAAITQPVLYGSRSAVGDVWWLDSGNGQNTGQILLGNIGDPEGLKGAFDPASGRCTALPLPSLQAPALLTSPDESARARRDCAEAIVAGDQSATINGTAAEKLANYIDLLLNGTCGVFATIFNNDQIDARSRQVTPREVAEVTGVPEADLIARAPRDAGAA